MSAVYREWTGDDRETKRLKRVTDHVHGWLYPSKKQAKKKATTKKKRTKKKAKAKASK